VEILIVEEIDRRNLPADLSSRFGQASPAGTNHQ